MSRLRCLVLLFLAACGSTPGSGFRALVEYHLNAAADACIRVRASPQLPAGQTHENTFALKGKSKDGVAKFGILIGEDWTGTVTVTATLHAPCGSVVELARDSKQEKAPARGKVVELALRLEEATGDGGPGDAGAEGAGVDAGTDAGEIDAGADDAGPITCDGGLGYFVGPAPMGGPWHDVAPYAANGVWVAGAGALFYRNGSTWTSAGAGCAGEHHAAWARPDGRVYFGTNDAGLRFTDPSGTAVCQGLPIPAGTNPGWIGDVYGITGFVDAGTVFLYSATSSGVVLRNTEPDQPALNRRWDLFDAGAKELWTIAGIGENALFVAGRSTSGSNGILFKFNPVTETWVRQMVTLNAIVNDISVVSPSLAYAGTEGHDLFVWDGGVWAVASNNTFGKAIYGVQAFGPTSVYAVGENALVKHWNGVAWTSLGGFDAGNSEYLARIRGLHACELWTVGTSGTVVRSQ